MENEMIAMPLVVCLIIGTAFISAIITTALPILPKWWYELKTLISRVFTRKSNTTDMVDVIIIAQLTERIDELEEQMNNVADNAYRRDKNRINNIRRDVRDYLKELQNTK